MIARLQAGITLSLILGVALWAGWAVYSGLAQWAWVGLGVVVLGFALFMLVEFVMVFFVHGQDPAPRATPIQLLKAWGATLLASSKIFCWEQPFFAQRWPDQLPEKPGLRGVLWVHGFVCNRAFWNHSLAQLTERATPFVALNLEPVRGAIQSYAGLIEAGIQKLEKSTGQAPVVVAHSMGGLAVRHWRAQPLNAARVHKIITIASPHHGTWLARFGTTANTAQMRPGSEFLQTLQALEASQGYGQFICFYSHCDNVAFPASTATLPGADNRHVPGQAHVVLAQHGLVFDALLATLLP